MSSMGNLTVDMDRVMECGGVEAVYKVVSRYDTEAKRIVEHITGTPCRNLGQVCLCQGELYRLLTPAQRAADLAAVETELAQYDATATA